MGYAVLDADHMPTMTDTSPAESQPGYVSRLAELGRAAAATLGDLTDQAAPADLASRTIALIEHDRTGPPPEDAPSLFMDLTASEAAAFEAAARRDGGGRALDASLGTAAVFRALAAMIEARAYIQHDDLPAATRAGRRVVLSLDEAEHRAERCRGPA